MQQRCAQQSRNRSTAQTWSLKIESSLYTCRIWIITVLILTLATQWHFFSASLCKECSQWPGLITHTHGCSRGKGHSFTASHLNRCHMKRDVKYHSNVSIPACSYLHPYLPSISLNEWGGGAGCVGGDHRTPKTAAAYKECEGPQPREQAGKPYHIWQQRQNLIFINEQSGHESGLTCKAWSPILDGVWYVLVSTL